MPARVLFPLCFSDHQYFVSSFVFSISVSITVPAQMSVPLILHYHNPTKSINVWPDSSTTSLLKRFH